MPNENIFMIIWLIQKPRKNVLKKNLNFFEKMLLIIIVNIIYHFLCIDNRHKTLWLF